jgi:hypothetical protein
LPQPATAVLACRKPPPAGSTSLAADLASSAGKCSAKSPDRGSDTRRHEDQLSCCMSGIGSPPIPHSAWAARVVEWKAVDVATVAPSLLAVCEKAQGALVRKRPLRTQPAWGRLSGQGRAKTRVEGRVARRDGAGVLLAAGRRGSVLTTAHGPLTPEPGPRKRSDRTTSRGPLSVLLTATTAPMVAAGVLSSEFGLLDQTRRGGLDLASHSV